MTDYLLERYAKEGFLGNYGPKTHASGEFSARSQPVGGVPDRVRALQGVCAPETFSLNDSADFVGGGARLEIVFRKLFTNPFVPHGDDPVIPKKKKKIHIVAT